MHPPKSIEWSDDEEHTFFSKIFDHFEEICVNGENCPYNQILKDKGYGKIKKPNLRDVVNAEREERNKNPAKYDENCTTCGFPINAKDDPTCPTCGGKYSEKRRR